MEQQDKLSNERPERLKLSEKRDLQYEKFRRNLRVLRAGLDISGTELGETLGFPKAGKRVLDLEYGRGNPKMDEVFAISAYFNVTIDELLNKIAKITFV